MRAHSLIAAVSLLCAATVAQAGSVSLNGVNIDGVTNQTFENCKVVIDAYGNVNIVAEGYSVGGAVTSAPASVEAQAANIGQPATRRYWVVTEKKPGKTQYDVDLFINGKWVRKFLDDERHSVYEVSKFLKIGPNKVVFVAKKNIGAKGRISQAPSDYFRIIIGEGKLGGRNVMITKTLVDYKRTALEMGDKKEERYMTAQ